MKRIIIYTIVTLMVLTAFTGCDEILEAFYPEFAEGNSSTETLEMFVLTPDIPEFWENPVVALIDRVWLEDPDVDFKRNYLESWVYFNEEYNTPVAEFFVDVPPGEYQVEVFLDFNHNGVIDEKEPVRMVYYYENGIPGPNEKAGEWRDYFPAYSDDDRNFYQGMADFRK